MCYKRDAIHLGFSLLFNLSPSLAYSHTLHFNLKTECVIYYAIKILMNLGHIIRCLNLLFAGCFQWNRGICTIHRWTKQWSKLSFSVNNTHRVSFVHLDITCNYGFQIVVWDALTAEIVARLPSNHIGAPRWLEHSPTEAAFVSCGTDRSVRFWKEIL